MYYGFVYEWTNLVNGKKYIGSHAGTENDGYIGSGVAFKKAIAKYGLSNFTRQILEYTFPVDRTYLLEREKFYLDALDAYHNPLYYNIARDVMGGDTKAGWDETRRDAYKEQIKNIWKERSSEERSLIAAKGNAKRIETLNSEAVKISQRERGLQNRDRFVAMIKARTFEERSISAKLGKSKIDKDARSASAKKAWNNTTDAVKVAAKQKRIQTRMNWSEERKLEYSKRQSARLKGLQAGAKNGRAKSVVAAGIQYSTLRDAMKGTGISEGTLHKRIKSAEHPDYYLN